MELEIMHNLPLRQRGQPRGHNPVRLSKFVDQLLHLEASEAMDVSLSDFDVPVEPIASSDCMDVDQPGEIDILGVLASAEKMEECNQVSTNNLITDTEMVYEYQHDSGVDSPLENLLALLPVYPEEDALLETIAAMDIPDPLDIVSTYL
ncbi:uncharacterized protein LOC114356682 [Ostrinia furnacalis]|uniref:uncharacterized protein LOC114356682 n=1 Tax=Ostrinia furnacalis TaxID=93504 RepID=UPI00103EC78C|nr:uncharacterized protein LOC114356682 [Ostrinia furnacalis]